MDTAALITDLAGRPPWGDGPPPFAPLGALMFCLLLIAAAAAAFVLIRRRGGGPPPWVSGPRPAPPEYEARRTLADRFARGDITVEEFMERASALNWNPGHNDGRK
ncbi:hypothetical protein SAMN05421803_1016 [Nocardiopsis flavescens]|uniref:SHOCT domain-containing protein n=1 Tax=Nocardiopsis flavescens TaxID=758803 RepID=A0A1M6AJC4_9ACTN|nr:SHOCT domain-containing protein [Nocardiopsis flavescens]SHI36531.1 hypothetical protein SAMN05421803_1016 [Nocardiopsis flavescens]